MGVKLDAVWETAVRDIPALKAQLEQLGDLGTGSNSS